MLPLKITGKKAKIMKKLALFSLLLVLVIQFSCNTNQTPVDTPRRGTKTMCADESFQPLIKTASEVFMGTYPDADLKMIYSSETEAMKALSEGTARTIFTGRDYTKEEKKYLRSLNITVTSDIIAYDAITFIVNRNNADTMLTQDQIDRFRRDGFLHLPGLLDAAAVDAHVTGENRVGVYTGVWTAGASWTWTWRSTAPPVPTSGPWPGTSGRRSTPGGT